MDRITLRESIDRALDLSKGEAAGRHITRLSLGWDLQTAYWPMSAMGKDVGKALTELSVLISRSDISVGGFEVDACLLGVEQVQSVATTEPDRLIRGVGLWVRA